MTRYKQTPEDIMDIITLFHEHSLVYCLFKCEHIFDGQRKNLDILFLTKKSYETAARLLQDAGFQCVMHESIEKYKQMWIRVMDNTLTAIHLHREIAWHGMKVLRKETIFKRKVMVTKEITVPSYEDQLIIHIAHILFENFKIKEELKKYVAICLQHKLDWSYINTTVKELGLKQDFSYVLDCFTSSKQPNKKKLYWSLVKRLAFRPEEMFYLLKKFAKIVGRKINLRRKGLLLAFVGVNGAGKTTLTQEVAQKYQTISSFFNGQFVYYFGWKPYLPTTKMMSRLYKNKNKRTFHIAKEIRKEKFSMKKEALFFYNYVEYSARYLRFIYPRLRKNKVVFCDRYFYDLYGQYSYGPSSTILKLLFKLFPKPDQLFILDVDTETLMQRDKNTNTDVVKQKERKIHPETELNEQKARYHEIQKMFGGTIVQTKKPIAQNVKMIITKTWKQLK